MLRSPVSPRRLGRRFAAAGLAVLLAACGGDGDGGSAGEACGSPPRVAVLSAFPAELAPLVAAAAVTETVDLGDRVVRLGTLGGVPVVLAMTGIGRANAEATTRLVLDRWPVGALVVSGVAGSVHRIGDVTVPESWVTGEGERFAADAHLLALARGVAEEGALALERCTTVSPELSPEPVCLGFAPEVKVGGIGASEDPYGGQPVLCSPDGGEVFGCDVATAVVPLPEEQVAIDMETAFIARAAGDVPFVAFRAVSDGEGDPLGLPGFPAQFFAYYGLAARNAASATIALLERLAAGQPAPGAACL